MAYRVVLVEDAERDIEDIYRYVALNESPVRADHLLDALESLFQSLDDMPERGNRPKELSAVGITEFHEVHYKPYRIIYRIMGRDVVIYAVVDGRQDMDALLQRRILR